MELGLFDSRCLIFDSSFHVAASGISLNLSKQKLFIIMFNDLGYLSRIKKGMLKILHGTPIIGKGYKM